MDDSNVLPIFTKIVHQPNPGAETEFSTAVEKLLSSPRRQIGEFGQFARKTLDDALSAPRNGNGSLDLGVAEMKAAAAAQQQRATAARELYQATLAAAQAQGTYNQETRDAIQATKAQAAAEEQAAAAALSHARATELIQNELNKQISATDHVFRSTVSGSTANKLLANSQAAVRTASIQAGQQLQDLGISIYSGQRASVVFAQQLPQLAFALSNLEGQSNKTLDRLGKMGTFLSGPYGLAVGLAVGVIGTLIAKQFQIGDAVGDATAKLKENYERTQINEKAQAAFALTLQGVAQALEANRKAQEQLNLAQDTAAEKTKKAADAEREHALAIRDTTVALLKQADAELAASKNPSNYAGAPDPALAMQQGTQNSKAYRDKIAAQLAKAEQDLADAQAQITNANLAKIVEDATRSPQEKIKDRYDAQIDDATRMAKLAIDGANTFIKSEADKKKAIDETNAALKKQVDSLVAARDAEIKGLSKTTDTRLVKFDLPFSASSITSGFGPRKAPTAGASTFHPALDFAQPVGTDVHVPQVGVVEAVGFSSSLGKYVIIDHGAGTKTRYGHLSDNSIVKEGDRVEAGDVIAKTGNTGRSTGPHLDYQVTVNGKPVDPRKGLFPIDEVKTNESAEKLREALKQAQDALQAFGDKAGASIANINGQFDESPKLIDQALRATRTLDQTIVDLKKKLGDENITAELAAQFTAMIGQAEEAKTTVEQSLFRPVENMTKEYQRQQQVQDLLLAGHEEEAAALQAVWEIEDRLGREETLRLQLADLLAAAHDAEAKGLAEQAKTLNDQADTLQRLLSLYPGIKRQAAEIAADEVAANKQRQIALDMQQNYLEATQSIRGELENLFSGQKADFGKVFKDLQAKVTVEKLFGPALRELDDFVKGGGVKDSVTYMADQTTRAGDAALNLADVLHAAGQAIASGQPASAATGAAANDNEMVVEAKRIGSVSELSPEDYFQRASKALMQPLLGPLEAIGGPQFAQTLSSVLGGVLYGQAVGGTTGGILGGLSELNKSIGMSIFGEKGAKEFSEYLDVGLKGAQTGSQIAGIAKALGLEKFSTTGSQLGGAAGGVLGKIFQIPGLDIAGSILGGILGGLFKKAKQSYADFGEGAAGTYILGGGSKYTSEANDLAKAVLDGLGSLTDAFGGVLSDFQLKIGVRNGKYMVDPTGNASFKNGIDFGDDSAAAIAYAIQDAIKDGALAGLSTSIKNLLTVAGSDLQEQLQKALDMQSVFDRLKAYKDPVGAAIDTLDKEFDRLKDIFMEAGASTEEYAQLEELYQIERTKAIKEAVEQMTASLQSLYDDLTVNNSSLSLRERKEDAQATYDALAARVKAGDATAYDDYAQAAQTLLDIERQISGSQPEYFALLEEVRSLTKSTIDAATAQANASASAADPFSGSAVPTVDNTNVVSAIQSGNSIAAAMNTNLTTRLDLIASILAAAANSNATATAARVSNY